MSKTTSCGFLYIASGEKYINEAINSVRSLKSKNPGAHSTLATTDDISPEALKEEFNNIVKITPIEKIHANWAVYLKPAYLYQVSPYDLTVFIDTDTFVCEDLSSLFSLLEYFDIAVAYSPFHKPAFEDPAFSVFEEYNTGLIAFRKGEKTENFVKAWMREYEDNLSQYNKATNIQKNERLYRDNFTNDQPSFARALIKSDLRVFTLPCLWNFRSHSPSVIYDSVKVIHYRKHTTPEFSEMMNKDSQYFRLWNPRDNSQKVRILWNPSEPQAFNHLTSSGGTRSGKHFIERLVSFMRRLIKFS